MLTLIGFFILLGVVPVLVGWIWEIIKSAAP